MSGGRDRTRETAYWRLFGEWMTERRGQMKPERWTQARLAEELALVGVAVKREWVNQVENGKRPSPELATAIQRLLGQAPDFEMAEPVSMAQLVEAINALVEELRLSRGEQKAWTTGVVHVLNHLEKRLEREQPTGLPGPQPLAGARR